MKIKIIYEDDDILVVVKPAGLLVHHTPKGEKDPTLVDWLTEKYPEVQKVGDKPDERPGIVHRLDKDTSGVMVIAKNEKAFDHLKKQFQGRLVDKIYYVLVFGTPKHDTGVIEGTISLKPGTTKRTVYKGKMSKDAVTEYKVLERYENSAFVEVYPKTGRTHQVRVHLASIGHPVLGDTLYSSKTSRKFEVPGLKRQMLHAHSITFKAPNDKEMTLAADTPGDFEAVLQYLRKPPTLQTQ